VLQRHAAMPADLRDKRSINIVIEITKKMAIKMFVRFSKTDLTKFLSAGINPTINRH
jgi:hypothetical protein